MSKTTETAELGIEAVAQRSGLSQHLIRVWERRYAAVTPSRTETNRRLYSEADAVRLALLNRAVHAGHKISNIAGLPTSKLEQLVAASPPRPTTDPAVPAGPSRHYVAAALRAVEQFDTEALEAQLSRAEVDLGQTQTLEQVIMPLLEQIGRRWRDGAVRIAQEHLATAAVRNHIGALLASMRHPAEAPGLVVATPAGQQHEVGALIVALAAASEGWRPVYLGASLPADEIAGAAMKSGARAVALSLVFPADDPKLPAELERLTRLLPAGFPVFVGGRSAASYLKAIASSGAVYLGGLADLRRRLEQQRAVAGPAGQ